MTYFANMVRTIWYTAMLCALLVGIVIMLLLGATADVRPLSDVLPVPVNGTQTTPPFTTPAGTTTTAPLPDQPLADVPDGETSIGSDGSLSQIARLSDGRFMACEFVTTTGGSSGTPETWWCEIAPGAEVVS